MQVGTEGRDRGLLCSARDSALSAGPGPVDGLRGFLSGTCFGPFS